MTYAAALGLQKKISPPDVSAAADRVCQSRAFRQQDLAQTLLKFCVEGTLRDRSARFAPAQIATQLMGLEDSPKAETDAINALIHFRACLAEYYREEGCTERIRFDFDIDNFALCITVRSDVSSLWGQRVAATLAKNWALVLACIVVAAGVGVLTLVSHLGRDTTQIDVSAPGTEARVGLSTGTVEIVPDTTGMSAAEIEVLGRTLYYPFSEIQTQRNASELFRRGLALEPESASLHASLTLSLLNMSLLTRGSGASKAFFAEAEQVLAEANRLAPNDPWVQSANGWMAYTNGDFDQALVIMKQAHSEDPDNPDLINFLGALALLLGDLEYAASIAQPEDYSSTPRAEVFRWAILAGAQVLSGEYENALDTIARVKARGLPFLVAFESYLIASLHMTGQTQAAAALAKDVQAKYPSFRPNRMVEALYPNPSIAEEYLDALEAAGWVLMR